MYLDAEAGQQPGELQQGLFNRFLLPDLEDKNTNMQQRHISLVRGFALPKSGEIYRPGRRPRRWCR